MSRKSRRRNRRRNRRRSRRGGQNYGSSTAKKVMTSKGRSNIGRWRSKRVSKTHKSKLPAPPSRKAPPPPPKRRRPTLREAAAISAERKLAKYHGNNRPQTKLGNVQAKGNAAWGAVPGVTAFRKSAWDARENRDLKPLPLKKISGNNVSSATLASKLGVSISEVNAGKKAANIAATKVAAATNAAAKGAAKKAYYCGDKGLSPALKKRGNCNDTGAAACKAGCVPAIAGGSRRRRRRRRRSRRRR